MTTPSVCQVFVFNEALTETRRPEAVVVLIVVAVVDEVPKFAGEVLVVAAVPITD